MSSLLSLDLKSGTLTLLLFRSRLQSHQFSVAQTLFISDALTRPPAWFFSLFIIYDAFSPDIIVLYCVFIVALFLFSPRTVSLSVLKGAYNQSDDYLFTHLRT